jgi:hemerythrin
LSTGQAFQWGPAYLTGLGTVDGQHQRLVDLINDLGRHISDGDLSPDAYPPLFARLNDYARYHFAEEEQMMARVGLDARHVTVHRQSHAEFLEEIGRMERQVDVDDPSTLRELMAFLTHWLAYHILGMDQRMAAQVRDLERGEAAANAFEQAVDRDHQSTEPLLVALNGLFQLVSSRNRALAELNASLEKKVAERTQALADLNRHLEELAMTDALTGLPNRRHALRRLESLWREAVEDGQPIACMMIDADHFKTINDSYGHEAGDAVLTRLALTLRHAVRSDDVVCRLGGDEFFIICPNTDAEGADLVAHLVLGKVNALQVQAGNGCWHGSVSVGTAVRREGMNSYEDLIRQADDAVYAAKRAGKNCVRHAS